MRSLTLGTILALGLSTAVAVEEPDLAAGKALVEQHCQSCHHAEVYTRPNRIIHNLRQLRDQIQRCEISGNMSWFDTDIENVVAYLNKTYYKF